MSKRVVLLAMLLIGLDFGCGEDVGLMPNSSPGLGVDEPAYDAWAIHDSQGGLVDEGMQVWEPIRARPSWGQSRKSLIQGEVSLHPLIETVLRQGVDSQELEVILSVRSARKLSFLPRYDRSRSPDDPFNLEVLARRRLIQKADERMRSTERGRIKETIRRLGGEVTEDFSVGNALVATLSAGALHRLLNSHPEIVAASPVGFGEFLSAFPGPGRDIIDGRIVQNSDQLVAAGYDGAGYRVGLIDTGVYASHSLLTNPDRIGIWLDCAWTAYSNCTMYPQYPYNMYYDPGDARSGGGHGTAMANIIMGNGNLTDDFRGVAPQAWLDSANVYAGNQHNALNQTAVLRAFNLLAAYDDVIVANIAANQTYQGAIALAADDLYDQGVIVVAPVGDNSGSYAYSPASAHKVLGIGAYYASSGADWANSGGTNGDGRHKPDVTAPTFVKAAANTGPTHTLDVLGTFPATAFAGGAAVLLRDYYDQRNWSADPGAIYTALITFGDEGGTDLDSLDGAGNLAIGQLHHSTWLSGVRYLNPGTSANIDFYVGSNSCDLRAGIWWAEDFDMYHNIVYLHLNDGVQDKAESTHHRSVFQKVIYPHTMQPGWWQLSIFAADLNIQYNLKVHYLIHYRTDCT